MRDSAEVVIIENRASVRSAQTIWIDSIPILSIGGDERDTTLQFHGIVGVTRLSNGSVVVADGSSRTLRYFAANGDLLAIVGGLGEGPGSYREISRLWRGERDSVFVYDHYLGRLTVYDASAHFIASRSLGTSGRRPILLGALDTDRLLGYWRMPFDYRIQKTGQVRDSVYLVTLTRDGSATEDSIGPLPATEYAIVTEANGLSVAPRAFTRGLRTAIGPRHIAVSSQDTFHVNLYSPQGQLRRSIRLARSNPPVTQSDIDHYQQQWRADIRNDDQSTVTAQLLRVMTYPSSWPAHGAIEFDAAGNLWVRNPTTYRDPAPRWEVFDEDGIWRETIAVPPRFGVFEIGGDYILGRWRNADDVEFVRLYGLRRSQ